MILLLLQVSFSDILGDSDCWYPGYPAHWTRYNCLVLVKLAATSPSLIRLNLSGKVLWQNRQLKQNMNCNKSSICKFLSTLFKRWCSKHTAVTDECVFCSVCSRAGVAHLGLGEWLICYHWGHRHQTIHLLLVPPLSHSLSVTQWGAQGVLHVFTYDCQRSNEKQTNTPLLSSEGIEYWFVPLVSVCSQLLKTWQITFELNQSMQV